MREMKDSGVEWIGKVPQNWKYKKVKYICETRNEKYTTIKGKLDFFSLENIESWNMKYIATKSEYDINSSNLCYKNDIVFGKLRPYLAKTLLVDYDRCCSSEFAIFHNFEGIVKFYLYVFTSHGFVNTINMSTEGTKMPRANIEFIKNVVIPIPSMNEQQKIADYLDKKCSLIDTIIEKQKQIIEKLKEYKTSLITEAVTKGLDPNVEMKDSGIEWIKKIPMQWKILKGKNILTLQKRSPKYYGTNDVITCFRDGEVTLRRNRREEGFTFSDKEIGYQGINKGDLIIHGMDGFAGAIGISDSNGKGSPVLVVCDSIQNKKFLVYYLRLLASQNVFLALATGIRERSCDLRWNKIAELLFPIPSINEQQKIADFLDKKCSQIDKTITDRQSAIEKLQDYKKSLIYDVVTGKKEV